jgi:hypothetical protein
MRGFWLTSMVVDVEMLTTAGILRSSIGASEGIGWLSVKDGKPIAWLSVLKSQKNKKINIKHKDLFNFIEIIMHPNFIKRCW